MLKPLRESLEDTSPSPATPTASSRRPAAPTLSRRGLFGVVGAMTAGLFVTTAGQSIGGPLRRAALLAPRGARAGDDFEVNKTAASRGSRRR